MKTPNQHHNANHKNPQPPSLAHILCIALLTIIVAACKSEPQAFDGERAMSNVHTQVSFGPRVPGSDAHKNTVEYIAETLSENDWTVEVQETSLMNQPIRNVIGRRGTGDPWIIMGAHYDTRLLADRDEDAAKRNQPVPGANDGASGVAVLLELSRVIPMDIPGQIWLVFFDAEDNGRIPGWDWILGSTAFANSLSAFPEEVIIVDMVGDADLNIYQEGYSDQALTHEIWSLAAGLGYADYFIPEVKHTILDDHLPFISLGIPAVDIIDIDYAYWHTSEDTPDKVSAESLQVVGDTLLAYLTQRNRK